MASPTGQPSSLPYEPVGQWGHISAIIEDRQYTCLGDYGAATKKLLPTEVEIFQTLMPYWQQKATSGQPAPGLFGAACTAIGIHIYVFGGLDFTKYYNTIHCLDTKRLIWSAMAASTGKAPMAKTRAAMAALHDSVLVIAGGYGFLPDHRHPDRVYTLDPGHESQGWTNELHCFHVDSRTWSSPETSGSAPPPCAGHSFTRVDLYRAVLFGGDQLYKLLPNHVYILDMKSWGWSRVMADGGPGQPWPVSRAYHSAVSLYDSDTDPSNPTLLVMWGVGDGDDILNDWWLFGVNAQHWRRVMLPDTLRGRWYHTSTIVHRDSTHKRLIHSGGLDELPENNDPDEAHPLAETTIVELDCSGTHGECVVTDVILSSQLGQPKDNEDPLPRHVQLTLEEEMRHLTVCDRIIQKKGKLLLNILHCVLGGHPRVGKSTLLARLTGQQPSITPNLPNTSDESQAIQVRDGSPISLSTGVAEKIIQVTVKKMAMVIAKVLQPGLAWEVITYDMEAIGLLKAVTKTHIGGKVLPEPPASGNTTKYDGSETSNVSASLSPDSESQSDKASHSGLQPFFRFRKRGDVPTSTATVPGFKSPLEIFKEALKNEKWAEVEAFLTDSLTIYFTDTGGQPEFQEVLPALISGPSLFFLVFKLTDDLNQKYRVKFMPSPTQETMPYESSFTVKEALLQSLASIASTCSYASYTSTEMVAVEPKIVLVGTHEDLASEGQIKAIQQELRDTLEQTEYYHQNMLVFASEDEPVVTVNNISSDGMDAQKIRKLVECIARHPSFNIEVPLPWLVLSLALRCLQISVISYEQCLSIANECGIDTRDELNEALWFLHTKVGVLRYFESVKELSDLVILEPQLIFRNITKLISSTFIFKQAGPYATKQFRKLGMFSLSTIDLLTKTSEVSVEHLSTIKLVKLMEHLHIIAPIRDAGGKITRYFMPCVLSHAPTRASSGDEGHCVIPPLLVTFRCGYCPKGVFSALIVHLISEHSIEEKEATCSWLIKEEVSRNRVTFKVGREFHSVSVTTHATHLEISVRATTRASADKLQTSPHEVCNSIRHCIEQGIVTVSRCLHYNCNSSFNFGFYCTGRSCCDKKDHPAVCHHQDPCVMICTQSGESYDIPDINRIWFGHPNLRSCQVPRNTTKPTMPELLILTYADNSKVHIVQEIGTKYEQFGILLLHDRTGARVKSIAQECSNHAERINTEILRQWLAGHGKLPVTWATLVEVLHDIGLSTLADGISTVQCHPSNRK